MSKTVRILNNVRLGLFPAAYGLTGALVLGVLNRIFVDELGISLALVGLVLAVPWIISPLRVWLGYRSDGFRILGLRREPYIIIGAALFGIAVLLTAVVVVGLPTGGAVLAIALILSFTLYGVGRNLSHNTFQALVADRFDQAKKGQAITFYEVATLVGSVVGAGALGAALNDFSPNKLIAVTGAVAVVVLVLALAGSIRQEPRDAVNETATEKARNIPFGQAVREVLVSDRQVRLFFIMAMFTIVGTLAQDAFLEPYGGLVLDMSIRQTAALTQFWGIGVLIAMLLSGALLLKLLGRIRLLQIGLVFTMLAFIGVIAIGITRNAGAFRILAFLLGLGSGLAGAGMLSSLINFTTLIRAGMLMGVWGMANQLGRALGTAFGGSLAQVIINVTGNTFIGFAAVFALEIAMLVIALFLTTRVNIAESRAAAEANLAMQPGQAR